MNDSTKRDTFLGGLRRFLDAAAQNSTTEETTEILVALRDAIARQIAAAGGGQIASDTVSDTVSDIDRTPQELHEPPTFVEGVDIDPTDLRIPRVPPMDPQVRACHTLTSAATRSLAARDNHWWQNWGKTQSYICQRMFFPTSVYEVGTAIRAAETDEVPLRAVGGGWSFSDVTLPGDVTLPTPPAALGVEALAKIVPLAETFSTDPSVPASPRLHNLQAAPRTR